MKKLLFLLSVFLLGAQSIFAQAFTIDTLSYKGDVGKHINVVIMGDGYTASEQPTFKANAMALSNYMLSNAPWSNYKNYFNVFAIEVVSSQSDISHPGTATDVAEPASPIVNVTTYFNCVFDYGDIHRLIVPASDTTVANVLAAHIPSYDIAVVLGNTTEYGGSGGAYATITANASSNEILLHELGHSFAGLADEYYAGDIYAAELPNMTQQTDPALVKWSNWMGFSGIGIYQHCCGGNSASWYKPYNNCKMEALSNGYCSVCKETIVESIHNLTNPILNYWPTSSVVSASVPTLNFKLTELMIPVPNTLRMVWELDNAEISRDVDSVIINSSTLSIGSHTLTVAVTDTTSLQRINNHASIHTNTVSWTIQKAAAGVDVTSTANRIVYTVSPNPAVNQLRVDYELEKKSKVGMRLVSGDGKAVRQLTEQLTEGGKHTVALDLTGLSAGVYFLLLEVDQVVYRERILKQ